MGIAFQSGMRHIRTVFFLVVICGRGSGCAPLNGGVYAAASDGPAYVRHVEPKDEPRFSFIGLVTDNLVDSWRESRAIKEYRRMGYSEEQARRRAFEDDFFNRR